MAKHKRFHITGLPRSGTTWMMNMLNAIPGVTCYGEPRILAATSDAPCLYDDIRKAVVDWVDFTAHRKGSVLRTDNAIRTVGRVNTLSERQVMLEQERIAEIMIKAVLDRLVAGDGVVGAKQPCVYPRELERIFEFCSDSLVVVQTRNPHDWIVSYARWYYIRKINGAPSSPAGLLRESDIPTIADCLSGKADTILADGPALRLCAAWVNYDAAVRSISERRTNSLVLRYEDTFADPAASLRRIIDRLDIDGKGAKPSEVDEYIKQTRPVSEHDGFVVDGRPGANTRILNARLVDLITRRTRKEAPCLGQ